MLAQTAASSPTASASPSPAKHKHSKKAATTGSPAASASPSARPVAPGGGPGLVWVNTDSHVYHVQGSKWYGTTKHGKYMSEQAAVKDGDHPAKGESKSQ